jgi:hypothetical protein
VLKALRQRAPYNLQSLRNLHAEIPDETAKLKRFGPEVFVNRELSAAARSLFHGDIRAGMRIFAKRCSG